MTTRNEAREAIYARLLSDFTGVPVDRMVLGNEEAKDGTGDWVWLVVNTLSRVQTTLGKKGNRKFEVQALVIIKVYTDTDTGVKQSDVLVEELEVIFEAVSFSGLDFRNAVSQELGPDGKWYVASTEIEFSYEEIK